jgi:hypothetical protein
MRFFRRVIDFFKSIFVLALGIQDWLWEFIKFVRFSLMSHLFKSYDFVECSKRVAWVVSSEFFVPLIGKNARYPKRNNFFLTESNRIQ